MNLPDEYFLTDAIVALLARISGDILTRANGGVSPSHEEVMLHASCDYDPETGSSIIGWDGRKIAQLVYKHDMEVAG